MFSLNRLATQGRLPCNAVRSVVLCNRYFSNMKEAGEKASNALNEKNLDKESLKQLDAWVGNIEFYAKHKFDITGYKCNPEFFKAYQEHRDVAHGKAPLSYLESRLALHSPLDKRVKEGVLTHEDIRHWLASNLSENAKRVFKVGPNDHHHR